MLRRRQVADEGPGVEPVVARADVDVVDVQQQLAPRQVRQRVEEFPLGKFIGLRTPHSWRRFGRCRTSCTCRTRAATVKAFFGVGQRQQVMQLVRAAAAPAQMIGNPRRLDAFGEGGCSGNRYQGHAARRWTGTHRASPADNARRLRPGSTGLCRPAPGNFRRSLRTIHRRRLFEDLLVVLAA